MKRLILALSAILSVRASAIQGIPLETVTCNVGIEIMYHGKPNHLNLLHVGGYLLRDNSDKWLVDFSDGLPKGYKYLQNTQMWIDNNLCLYDNLLRP